MLIYFIYPYNRDRMFVVYKYNNIPLKVFYYTNHSTAFYGHLSSILIHSPNRIVLE